MLRKLQGYRPKAPEAEIWRSIKHAIEQAWLDTDIQMQQQSYPPAVRRDYYYQFLNANTMTRLYEIRDLHENFAVELRLNERKTAYHARLRINHKTATISTITDEDSQPRHADFRQNYAVRQLEFDLNSLENTLSIPPLPSKESLEEGTNALYYQILHGPARGKKHELGFILVVSINVFDERIGEPVSIDDYINSNEHTPSIQPERTHPTIDISEDLPIKRREDNKCPEKQEAQDSLEAN